jgi:hypothetical protein
LNQTFFAFQVEKNPPVTHATSKAVLLSFERKGIASGRIGSHLFKRVGQPFAVEPWCAF